jgi:hypothetical protein
MICSSNNAAIIVQKNRTFQTKTRSYSFQIRVIDCARKFNEYIHLARQQMVTLLANINQSEFVEA